MDVDGEQQRPTDGPAHLMWLGGNANGFEKFMFGQGE